MATILDKAKVLANYTQSLARGADWGVEDQDILEWLISQAEKTGKLENTIKRHTEWLEWISAHSVYETGIPDETFPYLNMPPNEGACLALSGEDISSFSE